MRKLKRAAMHFERTKLNLDTVDLDITMINVEDRGRPVRLLATSNQQPTIFSAALAET